MGQWALIAPTARCSSPLRHRASSAWRRIHARHGACADSSAARELADIQQELQPGGAWLYGPSGCGVSALLREAVNMPAVSALPDGVVYVDGGAEPPFLDDVLQRLFERFYSSSPPVKVTPASAHSSLSQVQALFALDSLPLNNPDLRRLADTLSDSAVLVGADAAGPDTLLRVRLGGLNPRDAVALYASIADLADTDAESSALLDQFAGALGHLPLPLLLIGRVLRYRTALTSDPRASAEALNRAIGTLNSSLADERDAMVRAVHLALMDLAPNELPRCRRSRAPAVSTPS